MRGGNKGSDLAEAAAMLGVPAGLGRTAALPRCHCTLPTHPLRTRLQTRSVTLSLKRQCGRTLNGPGLLYAPIWLLT